MNYRDPSYTLQESTTPNPMNVSLEIPKLILAVTVYQIKVFILHDRQHMEIYHICPEAMIPHSGIS